MSSCLAALLLLAAPAAVKPPPQPYAADFAAAGGRCAAGEEKACRRLLRVALEDALGLKGLGAASWLEGQVYLAELATRAASLEVRSLAVGRLDDQALLARIAREDGNEYVRARAVARLREPGPIEQIARSDPSEFVRTEAVSRLSDPGVLHEIVRHDPSVVVRAAAVGRIDDSVVLAEVATSDPAPWPALEAARHLRDQGALVELARHAPLAAVRAAAVGRLDDQRVLADIARCDAEVSVRLEAVGRLPRNVTLLADAVRDDPAESVRLEALTLLRYQPSPDQSILAEVALHDPSPRLRAGALPGLADKALVGRIARDDASADVRKVAVVFVDGAVLVDIALNELDAGVRRVALKRLAGEPGLMKGRAAERALSEAVDEERQALERASRRYPAMPVLGGGYGTPTGLFATAGVRVFQSHSIDMEGQSWVLAAEAGQRGGRLKLGYALPSAKVGLGANVFAARDWRPSPDIRDRSFVGAELDLSLAGPPMDIVHARVGVMSPATALGTRPTVTWAVSVELPPLVALLGALSMPCIGCR